MMSKNLTHANHPLPDLQFLLHGSIAGRYSFKHEHDRSDTAFEIASTS